MEEKQYCSCLPTRVLPRLKRPRAYYPPLLHLVGWSGKEMGYNEKCMGGMEENK